MKKLFLRALVTGSISFLVPAGFVAVVLIAANNEPFSPPVSVTVNSTPACQLLSLSEQVATADVIMTGRVFLVVPQDQIADVIITPDRIYKGQVTTPSVHLAAIPAAGKSDGGQIGTGQSRLHFASDQPPFLLFLRHLRGDHYTTDECSGTRFLGSGLTSAEATVLGAGQPASVDPAPPRTSTE